MPVYTRPLSDILIGRRLKLSLSLAGVSRRRMRGATLDTGHDSDRTESGARLNQAIAALEGTTAAGHRRKKAQNTEKPSRRRMSAAARKRLSEAQRKW